MASVVTYTVYAIVAVILVRIAVVDARTRTISNRSVLMLAALWIVWRAILVAYSLLFTDTDVTSAVEDTLGCLLAGVLFGGGSLLFSIAFERISGKYSMGGGDIKLIAVLALYLGVEGCVLAVLFACILSLAVAAIGRKRTFPFAPFLVAGSVLAFVV